ncbi:MAG TPA: PilZ domain-containing protein [Bryobacteraceae bacterium]|nr:PilZ domain-containing protein [Bryobacteraceae bacterium]
MKKLEDTSAPGPAPGVENRREPRQPADGEIRLSFREPGPKTDPREVVGMLLDRSASGFRAQHGCAELISGQVVRFRAQGSFKGKARVVWTRILGDRVETGFVILP